MQNDDWLYYQTVDEFKQGNFVLDDKMAPTFHIQGILAKVALMFFPSMRLPILTLLIAAVNFYIFALIIHKYYKKTLFESLILSLFMFLSPLFVYTIWGFMTEQYSLFFLLCSFYYLKEHESSNKKSGLLMMGIFIFLGFMVRQIALVFPLALVFYYFIKKRFKLSFLSLIFFFMIWIFYKNSFPMTKEMVEKGLNIENLLEIKRSFSLIYGSLILLSSFLLPLFIPPKFTKISKSRFIMFLLLCGSLYFTFNKWFDPELISWGEYPYFENTFERTGFLPRAIAGTKYQFRGIYDLYLNWDWISKIATAVFLSYWILFKKDKFEFSTIFIICYLGLMITVDTFFDRYLIIVIPFMIISLIPKNVKSLVFIPFLAFLAFFSYQLSNDFVISNRYIWQEATEISQKYNVEKNRIFASTAWNRNFGYYSGGPEYIFTYDSESMNKVYEKSYERVEKHEIQFPASIFINPKIYLYKKLE